MKLIQNIDVYAPQHLGKKDVLIINDKIVKIKDAGSICADGFLSEAEMINGEGLLLTPGFIDCHVHVSLLICPDSLPADSVSCKRRGCRIYLEGNGRKHLGDLVQLERRGKYPVSCSGSPVFRLHALDDH